MPEERSALVAVQLSRRAVSCAARAELARALSPAPWRWSSPASKSASSASKSTPRATWHAARGAKLSSSARREVQPNINLLTPASGGVAARVLMALLQDTADNPPDPPVPVLDVVANRRVWHAKMLVIGRIAYEE